MFRSKLNIKSVKNKFFVAMILFSLLSVIIVTSVALLITYFTMKQQVTDNHRMSVGWLQNRLELVTKKYYDKFYDFEVDTSFKEDVISWFAMGQDLDYKVRLRLISKLNKTISLDSTINSIEIHNFYNNIILRAERSKAVFLNNSDWIKKWKIRPPNSQTNLVFNQEGKEIVITHQMNKFSDNTALALIVIRVRPYELQNILDSIKTNNQESLYIFNEDNKLIESAQGAEPIDSYDIIKILKKAEKNITYELTTSDAFWFYRSVNGGKLKIVQSIPKKTILLALNKTLLGGFFAAILSVIISLVFSFVVSSIISKPIITLATEIQNINLNDSTSHIYSQRQDEIGFLHESFNIMVTRNRDLIIKQYQSEIKKKEAQLRALQAQINPHFMYNTLQVIGGMALQKDAREIYNITLNLSDIMRYSLSFSKDRVPLKEEITYLNSYLSIQNKRFSNRINFEMNVSEEAMLCEVPKLILQPLVENCFEHGLLNKGGEWKIIFEADITKDGNLKFIVYDNGVGIKKEKLNNLRLSLQKNDDNMLKSSKHIGLINVSSRIKLQSTNKEHGIFIESNEETGTKITVLMQVIKKDYET